MKLNETQRIYVTLGAFFGIPIVCVILARLLPTGLHLYRVMIGVEGLHNVITAIILKYVFGVIFSLPIFVIGRVIVVMKLEKRKKENKRRHPILLSLAGLFLAFSIINFFYFEENQTQFSIQQRNKDIDGAFAEIKLCMSCFSDLLTEDYDEFTVNNCELRYESHITSPSGEDIEEKDHYEYLASFYYDETLVVEVQIGRSDYLKLFYLIPEGTDTKITVYKKSGFLRSIN